MTEDGSDTITITPDVRARLRDEKKRTGVTAIMLLGHATDKPSLLTAGAVNRWMSGIIRHAPRQHIEYVMALWAAIPDLDEASGTRKRGKSYPASAALSFEITEEASIFIRAELERTGVDYRYWLDSLEGVPEGLTARTIKGWVYREAKTTRLMHWNFVIERLRALPDNRKREWWEKMPRKV